MKKRTLIWLGVITGLLVFMFATPPFNFLMKPPFYAHNVAINIAVGVGAKEDGFDIARSRERPGMDMPACKVDNVRWPNLAPYGVCIDVFADPYRMGCGLWYKPDCVSVRGEVYLLQRPELLAKALDAMEHPCKYLPAPAEIEKFTLYPLHAFPENREKELLQKKSFLVQLWREAQCDTNPDKYRGKVTLTLYDVKRPVYVVVRPKE